MPIELITAVLVAAPPINDDWMDALDLQEEGYPVIVNTIEATTSNITTDVNQCQNTHRVPADVHIGSPLENQGSRVVEFTTCDPDGFDTDLASRLQLRRPFQVACNVMR